MVSLGINSQIVNIPDANFKVKLLSSSPSNTVAKDLNGNYFAIDANGNGEIETTEASEVSELNISNSNIASLEGLSSFQLYNLNCSNNQITLFDITSLNLTNLFTLDCSHNQITTLYVPYMFDISNLNCSFNSLTSLQFQSSNFNNFTELDCSHNQLTTLALPYTYPGVLLNTDCSYNLLTDLQLLSNVTYGNINSSHNQLSVLDVKNKTMNSLDLSYNQLASLDFQDRTLQSLSMLNVSNNNINSICKNENDTLPSTGSVVQNVCNNAVLGIDADFKKFLLSPGGYVKDINLNNINLDEDLDGEMTQNDLNKVGYIEFVQGNFFTDHFVTTAGINHLVNLKGIDGDIFGTLSNLNGYLGEIDN